MVLSVSSQEQDFLGYLLLHQHVQVDPAHLLFHKTSVLLVPLLLLDLFFSLAFQFHL